MHMSANSKVILIILRNLKQNRLTIRNIRNVVKSEVRILLINAVVNRKILT